MTERDPLVLIQESLTEDETRQFLADARDRWPNLAGAHVADILEHTTSYDMFLDKTEPFFEAHEGQMPPGCPNTAALHALIILGGELSMDRLLRLLAHAGLVPQAADEIAGEFPRTEVRYMVEGALDGKSWITFAPNVGDDEDQARQVFRAWQAQRDAQGYSYLYRLVRRTSTDELLASDTEPGQDPRS